MKYEREPRAGPRQMPPDHNICLEVLRLTQESANAISGLSEKREMTSQVCFGEQRAFIIFKSEPLRRASCGTDENQFFILAWLAQMLDIGARQGVSTDDAVTRRTWPAALDSECAHAAP